MEQHSTLMSDIMDEMDPGVLRFIRTHVTTFTRWDVIRFFHENANTQDTAENLARYVGRDPEAIRREANELVAEGILCSTIKGEHTVYALTDDPETRRLIATLVEAARERTFRMKLVYHILRAGGE